MEFKLPELGEGIYEAELIQWLVQSGDRVARGQPLLEVMTDKAVMQVPSPFEGTVQDVLGAPGDEVNVGEVVLMYVAGAAEPARPATTQPSTRPKAQAHAAVTDERNGRGTATTVHTPHMRVAAAPSVRRRARELGVDLSTIHGSGPGGRILRIDLPLPAEPPACDPPPVEQPTQVDAVKAASSNATRIPLRGMRRSIAENLTRSKSQIPHVSLIDECNVTELVKLRAALKETCEKQSIKLTYLAFLVRAAVEALKAEPMVNASLDEQAGEIVLHHEYNVGIACATPEGLLVPVIHRADQKGVLDIAREIDALGSDAKAGKSRHADLLGGTFTITSIGNIGGLISTPIIRRPEVAIMGVGKIIKRPIYDEHDQIVPASLLYLSFSFDHRVVDGDVAARFSQAIIRQLENPAALLLPAA